MNLIEFLRTAKIEDLNLPTQIIQKLQEQNLMEFQKVYASVQSYRVFGKCSIEGLTDEEMQTLNQKYTDLLAANGLIKGKDASIHSVTADTAKPAASTIRLTPEKMKPANAMAQPVKRSAHTIAPPQIPPPLASPLSYWENRFTTQLIKVELIGEILVSKEELEDISLHFSRLYDSHSEQTVLNLIDRYYPATFLVFMVGQGIHGYNGGDFWPAYEQALRQPINHTDFGKLFEKILRRYGKPQFHELLERSLRYVSLILAHGGIPVYCLKDFFSNIVLNCAIRPQLLALDGDELIEETLKHASYTANTDKPILHFMEYGGRTAANLLDRSRKMLLTWQQNQTLMSVDEVGLPAHLVEQLD